MDLSLSGFLAHLLPIGCVAAASCLQALTGFGLAIVLAPFLMFFYDAKDAVSLVLLLCVTGNFVQAFNDISPPHYCESLLPGIAMMLVGFVFMALGMWIYMCGEQCCGPRDALLVGLGKRLPAVPIGAVQIILWSAVTVVGWLLGGPVGVGTLLSAFGAGAVMQLVYQLLRFEPRDVEHRSVVEVNRQLAARPE